MMICYESAEEMSPAYISTEETTWGLEQQTGRPIVSSIMSTHRRMALIRRSSQRKWIGMKVRCGRIIYPSCWIIGSLFRCCLMMSRYC